MTERQPDDLVTALAREMASSQWSAEWINEQILDIYRPLARAVLARTDLVLPAADVIPKQAVLDVIAAMAALSLHQECVPIDLTIERLVALVARGDA